MIASKPLVATCTGNTFLTSRSFSRTPITYTYIFTRTGGRQQCILLGVALVGFVLVRRRFYLAEQTKQPSTESGANLLPFVGHAGVVRCSLGVTARLLRCVTTYGVLGARWQDVCLLRRSHLHSINTGQSKKLPSIGLHSLSERVGAGEAF
jgi:hypothetical protein